VNQVTVISARECHVLAHTEVMARLAYASFAITSSGNALAHPPLTSREAGKPDN
jgi:hypothetical protein